MGKTTRQIGFRSATFEGHFKGPLYSPVSLAQKFHFRTWL